MNDKIIKTRIVHKHDIEENWNKATNFIPMQGEIIVYDIDDTHSHERFKIGDGINTVGNLPFANNIYVQKKKPTNAVIGSLWIDTNTVSYEELLTDFEYVENDDGTYTLTEWKGTYNGEESTEIIIPDDESIIL